MECISRSTECKFAAILQINANFSQAPSPLPFQDFLTSSFQPQNREGKKCLPLRIMNAAAEMATILFKQIVDWLSLSLPLSLSLILPRGMFPCCIPSCSCNACTSEIVTILPLHNHGLKPHSMIQNSHKKILNFFFSPNSCHLCRPSLTFRDSIGPSNSRMGSTRREPCLSPKPWCMITYRERERERDWRNINAHLMCKLMHLMLLRNGTEELYRPRANYLGALCLSDRSESNFTKLEDWSSRERERDRDLALRPPRPSLTRPAIWHGSMCSSCVHHIQEYRRGAIPSSLMAECSFHVGIQDGSQPMKAWHVSELDGGTPNGPLPSQ